MKLQIISVENGFIVIKDNKKTYIANNITDITHKIGDLIIDNIDLYDINLNKTFNITIE